MDEIMRESRPVESVEEMFAYTGTFTFDGRVATCNMDLS
jgi:hypothetical protein